MKLKILIILIFITFFNALAQDTITKPRKKIGLVLSGGGAKGLAHIGILKKIEEAGIKIDYIGGTSMGAIVGGLYAAGYSANQLDSIFKSLDYQNVLKDITPREVKSFYEKKNEETYALTLPFNKLKLGIPASLSKGIYNYWLINMLTYNEKNISNFEDLSIPFVCIATDIENGKEIKLKSGNLAKAIIASGAFPTLYSPILIDNKYLIDGGVLNNYPANEVLEMGADYLIGIDVQDNFKNRDQLQDATRLLVQISNLQVIKSMNDKKEKTNLYIAPKIDGFNVISFEEGAEIIKKGEEAGEYIINQLKDLGTKYQRKPKKTILETDFICIEGISVPDLKNYSRAYVIGKLGFNENNTITFKQLREGIENLNATENFNYINYELTLNNNGQNNLILDLIENKNTTFLRFGLHYDNLYKSGVLINFTQKKLLFKNDVLSLDFVLGDNFRYQLDYFIDNGFYWSTGIKSYLNSFNKNIASNFGKNDFFYNTNANSINIDYQDFTTQFYLETFFWQRFVFGAAVEQKFLNISSSTLEQDLFYIDNSSYTNLMGYVKFDSFDKKYFPKKGFLFEGNIRQFLFSSNYSSLFTKYNIWNANFAFVKTFFNSFSLKFQTDGGFTLSEKTVPFFNFILGGYGFNPINYFKPFYGYDFISLSGNSYVKADFTIDYEIYKKHHLNFSANYANIGTDIFINNQWKQLPKYSGYALGYGYESIFGPLEIKYSFSPEIKNNYFWFNIGYNF
ncbi:MAG: patatin-like phospholipase family protein [Flavobacterium sp.]